MAESNSNLEKDLTLQIPEAKQTANKIDQRKPHRDASEQSFRKLNVDEKGQLVYKTETI